MAISWTARLARHASCTRLGDPGSGGLVAMARAASAPSAVERGVGHPRVEDQPTLLVVGLPVAGSQ